ncbi:hypothetical protein C8P64_0568 [Christiangramia gaetbulicola]|uniref:Uncharacterized protein n=1 Tax=Christiangramia gaetbulicola TaxID=703340 RepID=A0A2T6ALD2_9FLAO|nr:hypothetical protein C8P64_0568 [Christiangramia gaetbulicola]
MMFSMRMAIKTNEKILNPYIHQNFIAGAPVPAFK